MCFRVQEDREVLADCDEAQRCHLVGRGADHHMVAVFHRQAEQRVAHRATDDPGVQMPEVDRHR